MNPKDLKLNSEAVKEIRRNTGAKLWVWAVIGQLWLEKNATDNWMGSAEYRLQKEKPTSPP